MHTNTQHCVHTGNIAEALDHTLKCGDRVILGEGNATELELRLNISAGLFQSSTFAVGAFLLATEDDSEALRVSFSPRTLAGAAFNGSNVAIDLRSTNDDTAKTIANTTSAGDWPWRSVIPAPFAAPATGVLQLRIFLDVNVLEVFAADCHCPSAVSTLTACDCSQPEQAVALTALAAPSMAAGSRANRVGLFAHCGAATGFIFPASSQAWKLRPAEFTRGA